MSTLPNIKFSHVGLYVHDLAKMERFYRTTLGLVITDRGELPGRELVFMSRDAEEHHQLVLASGRNGALDVKVLNQVSFRKDPEGNRIEVFVNSPWYVEQPVADPLDLDLSDAEIARKTELDYQTYPGFQPRSQWQKTLKNRLDV